MSQSATAGGVRADPLARLDFRQVCSIRAKSSGVALRQA